jgi:hypothetical protein
VLKSTLESSPYIQDLYLTQNFKVIGGLKSWSLNLSTPNLWELKHNKTQEVVQILKTRFKLSDLTKGSQVLLKEYGILGFDIVNSEWLRLDNMKSHVLKLKLVKMPSKQSATQYLFEMPNSKMSELLVLTCPNELNGPCQFLIQSLKRE